MVALGDGVADIPRDRILGEPDDEVSSKYLSVGYTLEHRFSESWMLRNGFRYICDADDISATLSFPFIGGLNETTGELNRVFAEQAIGKTGSHETMEALFYGDPPCQAPTILLKAMVRR